MCEKKLGREPGNEARLVHGGAIGYVAVILLVPSLHLRIYIFRLTGWPGLRSEKRILG